MKSITYNPLQILCNCIRLHNNSFLIPLSYPSKQQDRSTSYLPTDFGESPSPTFKVGSYVNLRVDFVSYSILNNFRRDSNMNRHIYALITILLALLTILTVIIIIFSVLIILDFPSIRDLAEAVSRFLPSHPVPTP